MFYSLNKSNDFIGCKSGVNRADNQNRSRLTTDAKDRICSAGGGSPLPPSVDLFLVHIYISTSTLLPVQAFRIHTNLIVSQLCLVGLLVHCDLLIVTHPFCSLGNSASTIQNPERFKKSKRFCLFVVLGIRGPT